MFWLPFSIVHRKPWTSWKESYFWIIFILFAVMYYFEKILDKKNTLNHNVVSFNLKKTIKSDLYYFSELSEYWFFYTVK